MHEDIPSSPAGDAPLPSEPLPAPDDAQPASAEQQSDAPVPAVKPKKPVPGYMRDGQFRPGAAMKAAIFEVLANVNVGWRPDYKKVAERHGVKRGSLETLVLRARRGLVDLGEQKTIDEKLVAKKEVTLQAELMRRQNLLVEYEQHLDEVMAAMLKKTKSEFVEGNLLAFDQLGLAKIIDQMTKANGLRRKLEKGVLDLLEQLQAAANRRKEMLEPQPAKGTVIMEPAKQSTHAAVATSNQAKIREALAAQPTTP